jgi:hypothetical protein
VTNLLSKGIIDAEGKPGLNSKLAAQFNALDKTTYQISPAAKRGIHRSPESFPGADHGSTFQCMFLDHLATGIEHLERLNQLAGNGHIGQPATEVREDGAVSGYCP